MSWKNVFLFSTRRIKEFCFHVGNWLCHCAVIRHDRQHSRLVQIGMGQLRYRLSSQPPPPPPPTPQCWRRRRRRRSFVVLSRTGSIPK